MNKFEVKLLNEATDFLNNLDEKSRNKVFFNLKKAQMKNDSEIFEKLNENIWCFRTLSSKKYIRLFAFWDKRAKENTLVLVTHGIFKKTGKTPISDIDKAERIRTIYFEQNP